MGAKYGYRPIVMDVQGQKQYVPFDFSGFSRLGLNVSIDVGSGSYWSEIASQTTLDNLLTAERIDFMQFLERTPEGYIPNKEGLIQELKDKQEEQEQMAMMQQQMMPGELPPEMPMEQPMPEMML